MRKCRKCNNYKPEIAFKKSKATICILCVLEKGYKKSLDYERIDALPYEDLTGERIIVIFTGTDKKIALDREDFYEKFEGYPYKVIKNDMVYLLKNHKHYKEYLRQRARNKSHYRCVYCNNYSDTVDHFIPLSKNGTWDIENLYGCCFSCNQIKSDRIFSNIREAKRFIYEYKLRNYRLYNDLLTYGIGLWERNNNREWTFDINIVGVENYI